MTSELIDYSRKKMICEKELDSSNVKILVTNCDKGICFISDYKLIKEHNFEDIGQYNCSNIKECKQKAKCRGDDLYQLHFGIGNKESYCEADESRFLWKIKTNNVVQKIGCWKMINTVIYYPKRMVKDFQGKTDVSLLCSDGRLEYSINEFSPRFIRISAPDITEVIALHTNNSIGDIKLPLSFFLKSTKIDVEIYHKGHEGYIIRSITCPETPICDLVKCFLCKDKWVALECFDFIEWLILLSLLSTLSMFIFLLIRYYVVLYILIINIRFMLSIVFRIVKFLFRCTTRPFISRNDSLNLNIALSKRSLNESKVDFNEIIIKKDDDHVGGNLTMDRKSKLNKILNPRSLESRFSGSGNGSGLSLAIICFAIVNIPGVRMEADCSRISYMSVPSSNCRDEGNIKCSIQDSYRISIAPTGQLACLNVKKDDNLELFNLFIKTNSISLKCNKEILYYVPKWSGICNSVKYCHGVFSSPHCDEKTCNNFPKDFMVEELRDKQDHMGVSLCSRQCGCVSCGCFDCRESCVYATASSLNVEKKAWEVFKCSSWSLYTELNIHILSIHSNFSETFDLFPGITRSYHGIDMTLIGSILPPNEIMEKCFMMTEDKISMVTCNQKGELIKGKIGEVQCPTRNAALDMNKNCIFNSEVIQVHPKSDSADCMFYQQDPQRAFSMDPLPLILNNMELKHNKLGDPLIRLTQDSSSELQLDFRTTEVTIKRSQSKCAVSFIKLTGCYSCDKGAEILLRTGADKDLTSAQICVTFTFF